MNKLALGAALLALPGCASTMRTSSVPEDIQPLTVVDGIPYRERERLLIEVMELGPNGYESRGKQLELLANPTVVHVQNFQGQAFANSSLKVDQRIDGTISAASLTGESKASETLTNVATGLDAVQTAHKAIQTAEKERDAAALAAATAATAKEAGAVQAIYDATRTRGEVRVLEFELAQMSADTSASVREAKRNEVVLARIRANTAAVAAGQPIPYPNIEE
jgi:hypothetical protein